VILASKNANNSQITSRWSSVKRSHQVCGRSKSWKW